MKILLTGAAGFTGFFRAAAEAAGHAVVPLQADLMDKAAVAAQVAVAISEAVVHLAAISFVGHADDSSFYAVNGNPPLLQGSEK
jgi:nucleoside-diphosphate-sugar epimerase